MCLWGENVSILLILPAHFFCKEIHISPPKHLNENLTLFPHNVFRSNIFIMDIFTPTLPALPFATYSLGRCRPRFLVDLSHDNVPFWGWGSR